MILPERVTLSELLFDLETVSLHDATSTVNDSAERTVILIINATPKLRNLFDHKFEHTLR
jgi:hypothetical protein